MAASDLVQALGRGLRILEYVAAADDVVTLRDICEAVDLKTSTTHNLLRTLMAHGFVEKVDRPTRYRLGPAAGRLAKRHDSRALMRRVGDMMRRVRDQIPDGRITFVEALGGDVVATLSLTPELRGRLQRPGATHGMSPYGSASALLHQALWPAEVREAYRRRYPFSEYAAHLWRSMAALEDYLEQVRDERFAAPRFEHDVDFRAATPIFDQAMRFVGALGVFLPGALKQGVDADRIHRIMQQAVESSLAPHDLQPAFQEPAGAST